MPERRIHLLSEVTANQIAAGEVVERPASALKELIENSLDAGATQIDVRIRGGGKSSIEVTDNGCGMGKEDALMCLERHATSKIKAAEDLYAIGSYGFRGEALPSIASVSRFTLQTRLSDEPSGHEVLVEGGKIKSVKEVGMPAGTRVEVRHLFFNTPARQKFLRSRETESAHIERVLLHFGLAHPEIGFSIQHDEGNVKRWLAGQTLEERLRAVYGGEWLQQVIPVYKKNEVFELTGYIGKPGVSRPDRHEEILFVNRRAVENRAFHFGIMEGYQNALMKGQYPIAILNLTTHPSQYDVNIHPAKREIRFRDELAVRRFVLEAIRDTLADFVSQTKGVGGVVEVKLGQDRSDHFTLQRSYGSSSQRADAPHQQHSSPLKLPVPIECFENKRAKAEGATFISGEERQSPASPHRATSNEIEGIRILGVIARLYIVAENSRGLVLIDQHAAHERVLFEKLMSEHEKKAVNVQGLLFPITLQVTPLEQEFIRVQREGLHAVGLMIHEFGSGVFMVDGLPAVIRAPATEAWVREVLHDLQNEGGETRRQRKLSEEVIARVACRRSVKANDYLSEEACEKLLRDLLACNLPYCCPHGRPTMIQISLNELERKFGRAV